MNLINIIASGRGCLGVRTFVTKRPAPRPISDVNEDSDCFFAKRPALKVKVTCLSDMTLNTEIRP